MNDLTIFNFEQLPVRVVMIDGQPWFIGKDVATVLGYNDTPKAIAAHCKYAKSLNLFKVGDLPTFSEINKLHPQTLLIPESDIYRLVMRSKLPAAERFERFVMEELLPQIRQYGRYELQSQNSREVMAWLERTFTEIQLQQQEIKQLLQSNENRLAELENDYSIITHSYYQLSAYYYDLRTIYPELQLNTEKINQLYRLFSQWREESRLSKPVATPKSSKKPYNQSSRANLKTMIRHLHEKRGQDFEQIARSLNQAKTPTLTGQGKWTALKVKRFLANA